MPAVDPVLAPACLVGGDRQPSLYRDHAAWIRRLDALPSSRVLLSRRADVFCGRMRLVLQMPGSEICSGWAWVRFLWFASPGYPAMRFRSVKVSLPSSGRSEERRVGKE